MSDTASISSGIAARYATALFELAKEANKIDAVEKDLDHLSQALSESVSFRNLLVSPVYSRKETVCAILALGAKMELSPMVCNTLGVMAKKRRLFVVPALINIMRVLISDEKGEIQVDVTSANALTTTQKKNISTTLKEILGKDIIINAAFDETLIGGLIIKVGSRMIDTSIKSKLSNLQNVMKEVG